MEGYLALEATSNYQLCEHFCWRRQSQKLHDIGILSDRTTTRGVTGELGSNQLSSNLVSSTNSGGIIQRTSFFARGSSGELEKWEKSGFAPGLAQTLSGFEQLRSAPLILQLRQDTEMSIAQAEESVRGLNGLLQLDWLEKALEQLLLTNQWEQLQELLQSIQAQQLRLLRLLQHSVSTSAVP